jgi:hypothetical protein
MPTDFAQLMDVNIEVLIANNVRLARILDHLHTIV